MTVKELANKLLSLRANLQEMEIVIIAQNGLEFEPKIKLRPEEPYIFDEIEKVVITW